MVSISNIVTGAIILGGISAFAGLGGFKGIGSKIGAGFGDFGTSLVKSFTSPFLAILLYYVGNSGNVLEITPPLVLTMDEIDEGASILDQAFNDYIDGKIDQDKVAEFSGWFV